MRGVITEITKAEYLQACNEKVRLDGLQDQQDAEAERLRLERERLAREKAERLAREKRERENALWDNWYRNVPTTCKRGFTVGGFRYRIDASKRKIYKESTRGGGMFGFTSGDVNQELGI